MTNAEIYYITIKALNALQNARPRDQSQDSVNYHVEAINEIKAAIKHLERGLNPIGANDAGRWAY